MKDLSTPMSVRFAQVVLGFCIFGGVTGFASIVSAISRGVASQNHISSVIGIAYVFLAAAAIYLIYVLAQCNRNRILLTNLYLLLALFAFPILKVFEIDAGLFPELSSRSPDDIVAGAAIEIGRLVLFITALLWLSISKKAKAHLAASSISVRKDTRQRVEPQ